MFFSSSSFPRPAVLAGILSGVLLAVIHYGLLTGFLVVPVLPMAALAWAAFSFGVAGLSAATLTSLAVGMVFIGPMKILFILLLQLFPAWLFLRELLKLRLYRTGHFQWVPPGAAFVMVTLYALVFLSVASILSPVEFDAVLAHLGEAWAQALQRLDPVAVGALKSPGDLSHLVLALGVWMACALFYAAACLGNVIVLAFRRSLRASLSLQPFTPPLWLLGVLACAAALALLGTPRNMLIGQMLSLIALLPYFISGVSHVHSALRSWRHAAFWQISLYFLIAITLWPVLFLAAYGLTRQCLGLITQAPLTR
ncbi:MAG: hypothetical protein K2Q12_06545 [Rickettsiales bacterium]|nr:hypothetical protein [Rickettsiales bacterium]